VTTLLACALLCIVPVTSEPVRDRVDMLERNFYHDDDGREVFVQLIGWNYCPNRDCFHCEWFRLIKSDNQIPQYNRATGKWTALFLDGEIVRRIEADHYEVSWTQTAIGGDPEVNDRDAYPKEKRRELSQPHGKR
jgi:hypothetical protein